MWSIRNFFTRNKKQKPLCSVQFNLRDDGQVYIECKWSTSTQGVARDYAAMLASINTGRFENHIIKILENKGLHDLEYNKFIQQLFFEWKQLYETEDYLKDKESINDLVVKPSDFNIYAKKE